MCVAIGEHTRMLTATLVQHIQHVQGPGSYPQHSKKGRVWMGRREEGNRALSTVSLRPAWATPCLKTHKKANRCMTQDLANSSGGLEAKCSNLPSGTQNSMAPCSLWYGAWSRLQPGHKPGPHSHRPEASSYRKAHRCKEPHGGCSTEHGSRIGRAWAVQTRLTAQAKPLPPKVPWFPSTDRVDSTVSG